MIKQTFPVAERIVTNGLTLVTDLHGLLTEEAELLKNGGQPLVMSALVEKKQPLIQDVNQFSRQIGQVLATETLPNDNNGMLQYFERAKAAGLLHETLRHAWHEVLRISQLCQQLNEQNGASIEILRRHTQRSLHILKGNSLVSNTYGKDGTTKGSLQARTFISV